MAQPSNKQSPNKQDDFSPQDTLRRLSENLEQPDKFAQIFCDAAKTQKNIDETLKLVVKNLIKNDKETIDTIKDYQRQVDKEDWKNFIKKIGATGWAIIMLIVGAILQALSRKFLG